MPPIPDPQANALLTVAAHLLRAGRPADAIGPLREASRRMPGDAAILHDLGLACLESGRHGEAIAALRLAIAADPGFADSHLRLGIALEASGALDEALAAYRLAAALLPMAADASFRAGNLLETIGQIDAAILTWRAAAAAAAGTTLGRIAAAKALLSENRDAEAEAILRQEPDNAAALELLGNALADAGRFEAARAALLQAIAKDGLRAGSYYDVARCRRIGKQDGDLVARMQAASVQPGLEPAQRARVHLALGKAADDVGDTRHAMQHFDAATTIRDTLVPFDPAAFDARVDRLIARFTPEFLAGAVAQGRADPTPVLILGLPRSGTTLVEQIVSAHRDAAGCGELPFWNERGAAWDRLHAERGGAARPAPDTLHELGADYLQLLRAIAPGAARVTDKMPLNLPWAGLIHAALPHATILHCTRHPADTALSIHRTYFNARYPFPTGGAALVGYVRGFQRLAAHWRRVLPPARFVEVEYENLAVDPEPAIRRIVAACGLDWDAACLSPERNPRRIKTASKWQARQPIYAGAVGRWREYQPFLGELAALVDA